MKPGATFWGLLLFGAPALWWRIAEAAGKALNPDEVLILLIARPESWLEECRVYHHPPLFYWFLHWVQKAGTGELAVRSISVLAGMAGPMLLWGWMRRAGMDTAAWVVVIVGWWGMGQAQLGTELRGYALALALLAGAAWLQERWLQGGGRGNLLGYGLLLWLAVLTEYGVFFGWLALGVYGWMERRKMGWGWWAIQVGVVGMLGALYWWQVRGLERDPELEFYVEGYLNRYLVRPGDNWVWFAMKRAPGVLKYIVGEYATVGLLLAGGAVGLWRGGKTRALGVAACLAVLAAWVAAVAGRYPMGGTRHAVVLGVMLLVAGAAGLDAPFRGMAKAKWLVLTGLLVGLLGDRMEARGYLDRETLRQELRAEAQGMQRGEWVWTDLETIYLLRYYLREEIVGAEGLPVKALRVETRGGARLEATRWGFIDERTVRKDWLRLKERATTERVKLLDSGFVLMEGGSLPGRRAVAVQVLEIER